MTKSQPIIEDGIIAGNLRDKYKAQNPIEKYLVRNFLDSLNKLVSETGAMKIHEVGCGEGNLCVIWAKQNRVVVGSDFSQQVIAKAMDNAKKSNVDIQFKAVSIYDLTPEKDAAELIVCSEVLEHLKDPQKAVSILAQLANPYLIVSVPREPLWSFLNLISGKYVPHLGNTPGHIHRWSKASFLGLLSSYVSIIRVLTPIPWTIALCRSRGNV